ncbi:hypothetical protein AC579_9720 [Pseudocercospora musae]|uniref:O-methyltransferase domain-containing protein n=1 Tax=Pseudocercospora musae TaxID=113226 RepID=A0A139HZL6_9PEZI|nr:hypothetical protein AC579_9720 [Pseudocercospora musae]
MFEVLSHFLRQSFFLRSPPLTEQNLPDQSGRIVIITGGYARVGKELAHIFYQRNATIYLAGRSAEKATKAIGDIKQAIRSSNGQLHFLHVDLADLITIKPAVDNFMKKESALHVLVNNAGTMFPPIGSMSAQGQEVQIATNCTGNFLFTKLLTPILEQTAANTKRSTVRVLWAASSGVDLLSPKTGGMRRDKSSNFLALESDDQMNYGMSKVGINSSHLNMPSTIRLEKTVKAPDVKQIEGRPDRVLAAIDDFAREEHFLINIGHDKGKKIVNLIAEEKPQIAVELGGYIGYSALLFASQMRKSATNPEKEQLYVQDLKVVEDLSLLKPGATIVADNVLIPGAPEYRKYVRGHKGLKTWSIPGLIVPSDLQDEMDISRVL